MSIIDRASFVKKPVQRPAGPLFSDTKVQSLMELRKSGLIDERQKQVLEAMQAIGRPAFAKEIAKYLFFPINCITGRLAELKRDETEFPYHAPLIEEYDKQYDIETRRTCKRYRIIPGVIIPTT